MIFWNAASGWPLHP